MKQKTTILTAITALMATMTIALILSCDSDDLFGLDEQQQTAQTSMTRAGIDMSEYLTLKTYDFTKWTHEDWEILMKATCRLTIDMTKGGMYVIGEKSGNEVNISEKLYNTIKQGYANSNKLLSQHVRRIPRRKNASTEVVNPSGGSRTDCVGQAIAVYCSLDINYVNNRLAAEFPTYDQNGIHRDSLLYAVKLFKSNATQQNKFANTDPTGTLDINGIAAISGHAVNAYVIARYLDGYIIEMLDHKHNDVYIFLIKANAIPALDYENGSTLVYQFIK